MCEGTIADKRAVEAYDILEKIAQNSQQRTSHVRNGGRIDAGPLYGVSQVMDELKGGEGQFGQKEQAQALGEF
ncbi:hypothetical protein QYF36_003796 [Acer negundo]|nr:hypothetical protein QYF36_003796 [Acer negundo]